MMPGLLCTTWSTVPPNGEEENRNLNPLTVERLMGHGYRTSLSRNHTFRVEAEVQCSSADYHSP